MSYEEKSIKMHNEEHTPIQVIHPEHVEPKDIRLFRESSWKLRLTINSDRSYLKVKVVGAAPLSHQAQYICFLDAKDGFICMVKDLRQLDDQSIQIVQEELDRRYLTSVINRVYSLRNEFGVSYWDVETDRGRREFVMKDVAENAQWLDEGRLLLLDVDGNRFEIPDMNALDDKSARLIETVL
jgi:hypothetical protein